MQNPQNIIQFVVVAIFFSYCLCNKDYDDHIRIEAGVAPRPEKHREVDLKDGEYGYKIYYDDGDYDFEDDSSQDEQEKNDGLCMIVNQTNKEVQQRNNKALEKMEKYMEIYVLANSLRDYAQAVKKTMKEKCVNLTKEVDDAVESAQRDHIDIEDLTHLYKTLVAIPDNDKTFKNGTNWKKFVIYQLESVKDYIGEHFQHFKRELPKFRTSRQFYKRRNFYVALGDRGGLMSIFYYWFDSRVCKPRMFDEAQIREKLKEHLKYVIDLPEHQNTWEINKKNANVTKHSGTLSGKGTDDKATTDEEAGKSEDAKSGDGESTDATPSHDAAENGTSADDTSDKENPPEATEKHDEKQEEKQEGDKGPEETATEAAQAADNGETTKPPDTEAPEDKAADENAVDPKAAEESAAKTEEETPGEGKEGEAKEDEAKEGEAKEGENKEDEGKEDEGKEGEDKEGEEKPKEGDTKRK
ncbi:hypothetical protein CBL_10201 [Carabus blaptoides fortunei]